MVGSPSEPQDVLDERLGHDRAAELRTLLAENGLVALDADELERLTRMAAGYQRLARLVEEPEPPGG
jgi:hypothetical protein